MQWAEDEMESINTPCTSTTAIMRDSEVGDERGEGGKERLHPQTNDRETSTKQSKDGNGHKRIEELQLHFFMSLKSIGCKSR